MHSAAVLPWRTMLPERAARRSGYRAAAVRRGRATSSPPQFGQTQLVPSAQDGQNVHS